MWNLIAGFVIGVITAPLAIKAFNKLFKAADKKLGD
jgi:hypothetical protein